MWSLWRGRCPELSKSTGDVREEGDRWDCWARAVNHMCNGSKLMLTSKSGKGGRESGKGSEANL